MTPCLPLLTMETVEIGAMPRERPAVMKRPYHRDIRFGEIFKQNLNIQVVSMDIVQVYHIGLYPLNLLNELFGSLS